ncbi:MAG TPA: hypothetical protein VKT73_07185 [Xanthobacteraceae bacterium]|nr:hypothetical protein [Xanthobacteraceae bacterium]
MTAARATKREVHWVEKALLGVILTAVIFCALLLAWPVWIAMTEIATKPLSPRTCMAISDDDARLDCYDRQTGRPPMPPRKGPYPPDWLRG